MIRETWKAFEQNELTHSTVHYLMAIHSLVQETGYARAVDIAKYLEVSRANVSVTMEKLKAKNYIEEDVNRHVRLSNIGLNIVNDVLSKRRILETFFHKTLNLDSKEAELNACKIEHLISHDAAREWISFMGYFLSSAKHAKDFRMALKQFQYHCENVERCDICEVNCFFQGAKH